MKLTLKTPEPTAMAIKNTTKIIVDKSGADVPDVPATAVLYTEQTLTEEQKTQARENIGAQEKGDYITADDLQTATNSALAQAKASGAFAGEAGYTPQKGVDYFTDADKQEIAKSVEIPESLPNPHKLIFTGAVTAEYDGSEDVTVDVPAGGGGTAGGSNFPVMVDNIEIEEEGVISITLDIDLTACKEARFYISVPKNESGGTRNFYVSSANAISSNNMSWLSSFTNIATGTTVFYKAISETLGEFTHATGMQGSNISATTSSGGTAAVTAVKSPRTVSNVTKLIWADTSSSFPIGTKVQTFMWG